MTQVRKNLSLDPATAAILDGVENASDYVDRVVIARERLWRDAIGVVHGEQIGSALLLAACDALNGYHLTSMLGRTPSAVAFELHDAEELNGVCEKHGVKRDDWVRFVTRVRERPEVAGAVTVLAEEFWAGNAACERAMRRGRGDLELGSRVRFRRGGSGIPREGDPVVEGEVVSIRGSGVYEVKASDRDRPEQIRFGNLVSENDT